MTAQSRPDMLGLLLSCVGHVVIVGGLSFAGAGRTPEAPGQAAQEIHVELVNLGESSAVPEAGALIAERAASGDQPTRDRAQTPPGSGGDSLAAINAPARSTSAASGSPAPPAAGTVAAPSTAASDAELSDYQRRLYQAVASQSRYPDQARRLRLAGVTHLAFRLDRRGNILASWIQRSSGSDMLDSAARDALQRAQPLPAIPSSLPAELDFVIEIDSSVVQQLASSRGG